MLNGRDGVEDTRLEFKETIKIRDQGQGQILSRPKTGMLEAKAKNQGTQAQVFLQKKKVFKNFFSGNLQQKKSYKIFFQAIYKISTI